MREINHIFMQKQFLKYLFNPREKTYLSGGYIPHMLTGGHGGMCPSSHAIPQDAPIVPNASSRVKAGKATAKLPDKLSARILSRINPGNRLLLRVVRRWNCCSNDVWWAEIEVALLGHN
jgi:hypothetical protein